MKLSLFHQSALQPVVELFKSVFSASEGEAEGDVIADFVANLMVTTDPQDLIGCVVEENEKIIGCIFFSRFTVPSGQTAFILSPVAVSTAMQGQGVGQQLIRFGLEYLKTKQVDLVFTYGDSSYYAKTGFTPINETLVKAPFPLRQPIGWLAQSLDGKAIQPMSGETQCVQALCDPSLW